MVGNVESDYRIDGWSSGTWYEGSDNTTIPANNYTEQTFLSTLKHATLTVNLEDGRVSGNSHSGAHLGYVCQGQSGVGYQNPGCEDDINQESTTSSGQSTTAFVDASTSSVVQTSVAGYSGLCLKDGFNAATKDVAYKILDQKLGKGDALTACVSSSVGGTSLARVHIVEERNALFKFLNGMI